MIRSYQYSDGTSLDKNRPKVEPPAAQIPPGLIDPSFTGTDIPLTTPLTLSTRPTEWPTPDAFLPGEDKAQFIISYSPIPTDNQPFSLRALFAGGSVSVDWGDGSGPTALTDNVNETHNYVYVPGTTSVHTIDYPGTTVSANVFTGDIGGSNTVRLTNISGLTGVAENTDYYVVYYANSAYQISATVNGAPIAVGSGTATVKVIQYAFSKAVLTGTGTTTYLELSSISTDIAVTKEALLNLPNLTSFSINNNKERAIESYSLSQYMNFAWTCQNWYALKWFPLGMNATHSTGNFTGVFNYCASLQKAPNFPMSGSININSLFYICPALEDISDLDFTNVTTITNMANWLYYTLVDTLPATLDLSKVTNLTNAFYIAYKLSDIPAFTVNAAVIDMSFMFYGTAIQSFPSINMSAKGDNTVNGTGICSGCTFLDNIDNIVSVAAKFNNLSEAFRSTALATIPSMDLSHLSFLSGMFRECKNLRIAEGITYASSVNLNNMFRQCSSLIRIPTDLPFNQVTSAFETFYQCSALAGDVNISLDICSSAAYMFYQCSLIQSITITNLANITSLDSLATQCSSLHTANISGFGAGLVSAANMFDYCTQLQNVVFDTTKLIGCTYMFRQCKRLTNINNYSTELYLDEALQSQYMFEGANIPFNKVYLKSSTNNLTNMFNTATLSGNSLELHLLPGSVASYTSCSNVLSLLSNSSSMELYLDPRIQMNASGFPIYGWPQHVSSKQVWTISTASANANVTYYSGITMQSLIVYRAYKFSSFTIQSSQLLELELYEMVNAVNVTNNKLTTTALNRLFESLGNAASPGVTTITVTGNPGAATCDTSIATAKGWNVVTA